MPANCQSHTYYIEYVVNQWMSYKHVLLPYQALYMITCCNPNYCFMQINAFTGTVYSNVYIVNNCLVYH